MESLFSQVQSEAPKTTKRTIVRALFVALALSAALVWAAATSTTASAQVCSFNLGFKLIADQIPVVLGGCLEDEHHNAFNGDSLQQTSNGLLVWRKLDNFTAFTDGYRTWVNGPFGIQRRLNTERYEWEAAPPAIAEPIATPVPLPITMPVPTQLPTPIVSFTVDSATIAAGQCVSLRWNAANTRAVYLLGDGIDSTALAPTSNRLVCPIASTSYALNVVNLAGTTTSRSVAVVVVGVVAPTVSFTVDRPTINAGDCTALRWNVVNVREIHLRGPNLDVGVTGQGDRSVCPAGTSIYRLDVTDLSGNTTAQSITITVQGVLPTPSPTRVP
jgi:hypothetical protein